MKMNFSSAFHKFSIFVLYGHNNFYKSRPISLRENYHEPSYRINFECR